VSAVRRTLIVCAAFALTSCSTPPRDAARPSAEFLLVSDDSTTWVRTFADSVAVQRAPIRLSALDRRLIELYIVEEPIDFADASYLVPRVYRRDLARGDSVLLFADSVVIAEAAAYMRAHPDADRIEPDDAESEVEQSLESTVTLLGVVGPTLGIEVHRDRSAGERGTHDTFQATIDLHSSRRLTLAQLVDSGIAREAFATAGSAFRDAVMIASQRASGRDVSRALSLLTLDPLSFSLTRLGDSLAVRYLAHDEQLIDETRDTHRFSLEPVSLRAPGWWRGAQERLPRDSTDAVVRFDAGAISLTVTWGSYGRLRVASHTAGGSRPVLEMVGPIRELVVLSDSLIDPAPAWRRALERAVTESGYTSDQVRTASLRNRARPTAARQAAL
jgi:hypothetical protein